MNPADLHGADMEKIAATRALAEIREAEDLAASFREETGQPVYVSWLMYAELKRRGMDVSNVATYPEDPVANEP